jgi:hypothetical protein
VRDGRPVLVLGGEIVAWTEAGYSTRARRPAGGDATVITPPATVAVLRAGYPVQIDASAYGVTGSADGGAASR